MPVDQNLGIRQAYGPCPMRQPLTAFTVSPPGSGPELCSDGDCRQLPAPLHGHGANVLREHPEFVAWYLVIVAAVNLMKFFGGSGLSRRIRGV
jgi:hypothetical protein